MKNNIIVLLLLLVIVFQLACRNKDKPNKKDNVISRNSTMASVVTDTVLDKNGSFYSYIKDNYPVVLKHKALFFYQEKDIDLDGLNESIFAFSPNAGKRCFIEDIFVLKNDNGTIKEITGDFGLKTQSIKQVKLISLKGKKQNYIYLNYLEGDNKNGFAIYEIIGNEIKQIFVTSAINEVVNSYHDELTDSNNDGQFDGHLENIEYFKFNVEKEFAFENGLFQLKGTKYIFKSYPPSIEEVLDQYLFLRSLDVNDSSIKQRLQELCIDNTADNISLDKKDWMLAHYDFKTHSFPSIFVERNKDGVTAKATSLYGLVKGKKSKLNFELKKSNEKWQITKIELL